MSKLIQLVGPSGTGKSDIVNRLYSWIQSKGLKVEKLVEPGPLRGFIKDYRLKENKSSLVETALFTTDRLMLYQNVVEPRKNERDLVFLGGNNE